MLWLRHQHTMGGTMWHGEGTRRRWGEPLFGLGLLWTKVVKSPDIWGSVWLGKIWSTLKSHWWKERMCLPACLRLGWVGSKVLESALWLEISLTDGKLHYVKVWSISNIGSEMHWVIWGEGEPWASGERRGQRKVGWVTSVMLHLLAKNQPWDLIHYLGPFLFHQTIR